MKQETPQQFNEAGLEILDNNNQSSSKAKRISQQLISYNQPPQLLMLFNAHGFFAALGAGLINSNKKGPPN